MAALEQAAIYYLANNFSFDLYYVPQDSFNLIWVLNGGIIGDLRWDLFFSYYGLEPGEVEVIPEEPIPVYFAPADFLLGMLAWFVANGADCAGGGFLTAWPEPGNSPCD